MYHISDIIVTLERGMGSKERGRRDQRERERERERESAYWVSNRTILS
jgi:hypothetical protein